MATKTKRTVMLLLLLIVIGVAGTSAQKYTVYSVIGKVYSNVGGSMKPLNSRELITKNTIVNVAKESALTIIDEKNQKMFFFTKNGINTVADLLSLSAKTSKNLSKQYLSYLVKQLFSPMTKKMVHPDTYMQTTGTSFRAASKDSMLANSIVSLLGTNTYGSIEKELLDPKAVIQSDLDVSFELVSCYTGQKKDVLVEKNSACYARIKNGTNMPLYINILNIDSLGSKYMIFPMDEECSCRNLLVPANCTVSFTQEPFLFSNVSSKDAFIMVANEEPIDFSILMNPIKPNGSEKLKIGLYRQIYETR